MSYNNRVNTKKITNNTTLSLEDEFLVLDNVTTNIIISLLNPTLCTGKVYRFNRNNTSTGTVTLNTTGGIIQNLNGTLSATTTIGLHNANGSGLNIVFWSDGVNWYR
jgi:hypothetical protein